MGSSSSRKILCSSREPSESTGRPVRKIRSFFEIDRLVCDELCQDAQRVVRQPGEVCNRVPVVQKPSEGLQQKDVRPVLPM
jgi:hypothetical protein